MKNIIIIFLLFSSYNVIAQSNPSGIPTQFSTGWFRHGWDQSDSGKIFTNRNPNFTPRFPGTVEFYQDAGVDSLLHLWTGARWLKLIPGFDSTSLSNRINLKLNITDTVGKWLAQTTRLVDTIYRVNDSTVGYTIKGNERTFQILGRSSGGGGGSGTVTSVGLSLPSAFNVTPSTITTNGIFAVTGAGTTSQYIRGNGTLATTDTGMIPNFYLKVRGLLSGTSPITFNTVTGAIGIPNANISGTKGAATFSSSGFTDNGSGLISLSTLVSAGSCTGCSLNIDANGRITSYTDGAGGATNNANVGTGYRWLNGITQELRTVANSPTITWDSVSTANTLTAKADTSILATQYDLSLISTVTLNNIGSGYRLLATPVGNFKSVFGNNTIIIDSSSNSNALTWKVDTSVIATQFDLTLVNNGLSRRGDTTQLGALNNSGTPLNHDSYINTAGFKLIVQGSTATSGNTFEANNLGAGTGVSGSSISEYGVLGNSTSLYGVYGVSGTSNAIRGWTTNGNTAAYFEGTASSTNTVIPTIQIKRTTSGTAAAGIGSSIEYYVEKDNGANNTVSNSLRSLLTTATSGGEVSQFEIYGVNAATLARKMAITGEGQQIWDGYPALTAQVDTTTYKPVGIDGAGNVVKMAGWAGSGSGGGATLNNIGTGFAWAATPSGNIKRAANSNTILWDSTSTANSLTANVDTSVIVTVSSLTNLNWQQVTTYGNTTTNSVFIKTTPSVVSTNIYFFGNSFTTGYGLDSVNERFTTMVSNVLGLSENNFGLGGQTMMKRVPIDPWGTVNALDRLNLIPVKASTDRFLVVALGLNDLRWNTANYTAANYKIDYQRFLDTCIARNWTGNDILIISPFYVPDKCYYNDSVGQGFAAKVTNARNLEFGDTARSLSNQYGTKFVNGNLVLYNNGRDLLFQADSIHPNYQGHIAIATAILEKLNIIYKTNQSFAVQGITELDSIRFRSPAEVNNTFLPLVINDSGYVGTTANGLIYNISSLNSGINYRVQGGNIAMSGKIIAGGRNWLGESDNLLVRGSALADTMHSDVFGNLSSNAVRIIRNGTRYIYLTGNNAIGLTDLSNPIGDYSLSAGYNAQASGAHSLALGAFSQTNAGNAFAVDAGHADGQFSTAFHSSTAAGQYAFAYNSMSYALGNHSIAWGPLDTAVGNSSVAIGNANVARTIGEVVLGMYCDSTITGNANVWTATDPILRIGSGQAIGQRTDVVRINKNGQTILNKYGVGTFTGTPAYILQVTSTGQIIEGAVSSATTLYNGDDTISGNRIVTGSNNSLTFNGMFNYRVNANVFAIDKTSATAPYSFGVIGASNLLEIGYTPTIATYSKGAGVLIDTNNNVGLGTSMPTTAPLYASGGNAYANNLLIEGGVFYNIANITSNTTLDLEKYYIRIDATSGNVTVTLPAASTAFGNSIGIRYVFKRMDNSGNSISIVRAGSDTIDGATSISLTTQYEVKELQCSSSSTWDVK